MNKWLLGILCISLSFVAEAEEKSRVAKSNNSAKLDQLFNGVDSNGDGKLSLQETEAKAPAMAANFDKIDLDHDGGLSKKEITAFSKLIDKNRREFGRRLQMADKDKNGKLSRDETMALPRLHEKFDEIDSDHDQQLVIKEISDYLRAQANIEHSTAPTAAGRP